MPEVVGREIELDALRAFIDAVPEGPSALVLEGEAGIGKTTLCNSGVALARERSFRVLSSRSAETEAKLSYAGLLDLLGEVPDDALEELPAVQRHALEVALLRADPGAVPVDPRTVSVAALGVLRWFAADGPMVIALDDTQWMDASSADALSYALRRLDHEPVGILVAARTGAASGPLGFVRRLGDGRAVVVPVGPLAETALERLVRKRFGNAIPGPVLLELHRASAGNPLLALEIARASLREGIHGSTPAIVLPSSLKAQVGGRFAGMSAGARGLLLAAAALSRPTASLVVRAAGVDDDVLTEAIAAGIVEADGDGLHFTHPVYASVAYAGARLDDRVRIHRRLAALVGDPEERARHLALAGSPPDADIADALEEAAVRTRARGAPAVAGELLLESARFTPEERPDDARCRTVQAADDLYEGGDDIRRVMGLLEGLLSTCPPGPPRAEVLYRLGRVGASGGVEVLNQTDAWLEQAEAEAEADPSLSAVIRRVRIWPARQRYLLTEAAEHAGSALEPEGSGADPGRTATGLAVMAWAEMVRGRGVAEDMIQRALALWRSLRASGVQIVTDEHPCLFCGEVFLRADRLDEARTVYAAWREEARDLGSDSGRVLALTWLCEVERLAGEWDRVARYADEAGSLATGPVFAKLNAGMVAAHRGRVDEARRDLSDLVHAVPEEDMAGELELEIDRLAQIGFLELSLGNLEEAHEHLSRVTELFMASGTLEPGMGRFLPDAIETLVGLGDLAEAERLTDWLEERGRALDRVSALATGARCRGLLLSATGDHEGALEHLERAVIEHARLPMPFERARTLLVLGSVRRRADHRRAAREALEEALGIFEHLGAVLWADAARAELASIGGRTTAARELTSMESRVARLAAAGRTNREIAESLFLSVRTVESHLSHAYRKLGVRSRTELSLALERPAEG